MSAWNIYHKDGSKLTDVNGEQITVHGLEYSDSWMGECFLTINFKHEVPINFQIGDYIVYRGERFELNYEPGKDKQARPDTYGEGFVYDSVKFNALQDELARAEFLDVVLNDNELHYTALPKFPFYVQTLDDLLDRIQACLNEQIGAGLWKIYSRNKERSVQRGALESEWLSVYGEKTDDNVIESMSITVDSQTCWQALALVNEKWDINFIVRGRNIYVGTTGIQANHIFKYGLGNGLYEIVQNADSDQSVVTRLRAYGSEKNLPSHYYADLGVKYVANITKVVGASTNVTLELDLDYIETYFKNPRKYIVPGETGEQSLGWVLKVTFDFKTEITGYVTQAYDSKKCRFYSELKGTQTDTGDEESKEKLDAFIAQVKAGNTKMYITSGLNKKAVPSSMKEYAKNLPNNMSINRLMLPGFPHVSLSDFYNTLTDEEKKYVNPTGRQHKFSTDPHRPYIDSINIEQIGLRSASQFFETDDKTNGVIEIYPTIEEMEIGGVRVDEIDEGVAPDDDGRFGDNETVKNVDIYLKKAIDFDINDLKDDDFSISMKDGMCGGRTFKVASSTKIDGRWRLTIERVKDDALELWFPYKDYPIKKGDHFVLTDITLPDSYVNAASLKLLKYAIAFIDKNDYTRYVYQPKVDEIFMARQHDLAEKDTTGVIKSLHDTLKAGDLMEFEDTDLRIGGVISIDQLTIKEEDGKIPTYDITLREDKEVGTIQKIQQQISSLQSGNGGTGAGLTTTQVKNQVATEGSKHFISKINDDIANGTITWEKVQKFLQGLLVGGGSWTPDAEGRSHLITDYLEVRMKAIFEELVINKTSTIGGKEIISPAGGMVAHKVEEVTVTYNNVSQKAYRCYFLAEQDGDAVDNDFAVGDQVRSESFNVRKGTYHKAGNHFYWRLAIGRNEEPVELEGKKYHYIDLSDIDCATASDVPAKGDVLSQCGNRTDVERQNCLIFSAVDTYSPSISLYHGINSYSFANREYVEYGVNKQTNKAFFHVYGDMYFGDRPTSANNYEGDSYVKYDSDKKKVTIKGDLDIKSTYDGKTLDKYIADKSLDKDAVETIIKKSQTIIDLQNQIDGAIETWFYDGVPTLKNAPAIGWTTDDDKKTHLGDLYYDNKTGKAYRFAKDGSTYKWIIITDTELTKALEDSRQALKDAKSKRRIFGSQPVPPYDVNDMWVNATYPSDGSTYKNEILKCSTAKAEGEKFDIADWKLASKYTDDTVAEEAKKAAEKAQAEIKTTQSNLNTLGTTVSNNKKAFDDFTSDGYLDSSEIAAIAQDSKRLEDDYNAAVESYNNVVGSKFLLNKDGNETTYKTDLVSAKATLDSAKNELITYLSDIVSRYNASDSNGKATIKAAAAQHYTNFTNAYKAFYDKLGVANNYITSNLFDGLNTKLITNMAGLEYIKAALVDGDTVVKGGLILSTLIALRNDKGNVTAGINGTDTKENGIALWLGGKAIDRQASTTKEDEMDSAAKALLRFDGTGYFANGNLWWDADGVLHADPTSFIINKNNVGVQLALFAPIWKSGTTDTTKLANVLSIDPQKPFTHLDVSGNITTEGSLRIGGIYLSWDSENNALRLSKDAAGKEAANFYALGGITAYGKGAGTSGGGGLNGSVKSYSNALKLTSESLSEIASAYSIKALDSRISSLEGGSATAISVSGSGNAVTSVTKNGTTISVVKGSTFLTNHQSLDGYVNAISVSGSGNAITAITKSGKSITFTKGATFLTSHQSLANYYTKSSVDSLLSGKSATSHTHSVKINGVTKTIAASGGAAVDLGTYLTSHQSLADYAKKSEIPTKVSQLTNDTGYITSSGSCAYATSAGNADKVDGVHVTWAGVLTSTSHLVAWESDGSALRDINPANVTVGNSDKLDGIHANGLLTALSNSDKGISITVGGTTKSVSNISVNYASSAGNADTVDGLHSTDGRTFNGNINWSPSWNDTWSDGTNSHPWYGFDHRYANTGAYSTTISDYFGMTIKTYNTLRLDYGKLLLNGTSIYDINVASATKLAAARTIWGQGFDGTGNVNGTIYINNSNSSNGAIRLNNDISAHARISAIDDQVIFNTGNAIRFGETNWDWNQWAGLKYTHSNKTIYLGIADKSVFIANSAQSNGTLKFPGITTITPDGGARIGGSGGDLYLGNANNSNWVKVQDICSHNGSNYWYIYQNGNAHFNNIGLTGATINGNATINGDATINGNLSVTGLISNKGILPANYEFNNKGAHCYVSADALCSGITAITDSIQINQVVVQYSNDSGNSWTNYSMSNDAKFNLYASNAGLTQVYLGYNVITGNNDAEKLAQVKKNELIVSFYISNSCYAQPYFASVDISNGIDTICTVDILNNSGAIVETYTKHMTGWNQINYISLLHDGNVGYGVGNNDRRYIRFRFKHDQKTTALRNTVVNKIRIFSFTKYSFPTDRFMGHTGHIYNFDYNMNTYFPNSILAKGGVTAYASSDIRLKQDLRKLDYLGIIKAMGGTFSFAWKKDNTRSIGWIAQHVLHNPQLKDIVETDEKGYYKINYWSPKLIATAFGAIEQVGDEVSRLKARVVFLESEVLRLSGDKEDCNKKRLDNKNINLLN
nr:MAG: endopeptidase tail [Bacteriophage sp.]